MQAGSGPTCTTKDKIQDIEILGLEDIPMLPVRIRVAVQDAAQSQ